MIRDASLRGDGWLICSSAASSLAPVSEAATSRYGIVPIHPSVAHRCCQVLCHARGVCEFQQAQPLRSERLLGRRLEPQPFLSTMPPTRPCSHSTVGKLHRLVPCSRPLEIARVRSRGPRQEGSSTLSGICNALEAAFFELCICNNGRSGAEALLDFVEAGVLAHTSGYSLNALQLELSLSAPVSDQESILHPFEEVSSSTVSSRTSEFRLTSAGYRLTSSEQQYRDQWLQVVYLTVSRVQKLCELATDQGSPLMSIELGQIGPLDGRQANGSGAKAAGTQPLWMESIVDRIVLGQMTGEEQSAVRFDEALSSAGVSGGVASQKIIIAPQWVPVSQLVLMTMKVFREMQR